MSTVNVAIHDSFPFLDDLRALVAGKSDGDWTKVLLKDGATSAVTVTVSAVSGQSGYYDATFTPTSTGIYQLFMSITHNGQGYNFQSDPFDVIPAAADPAAIATAIAAVQTTVDGIDANVDVAVSTRATPGAYVTTGSAVATSGAGTIYQGDDQVAAASRALVWSTVTESQWPDLTGATVVLQGEYRVNAAHTFRVTGQAVTPTGATKQVRFELDHATTAALKDGVFDAQVIATLAGGQVATLVETTITVRPRRGD